MLWGGRFEEQFNNAALEFSSSLSEDINLFSEEIKCGKAYAAMLHKLQILTSAEKETILNGLNSIEAEWNEGKWSPNAKVFEDVHSAIESRLYELIGDVAGKLRSGRSRNDQVVTSLRMWMKKSVRVISASLNDLQKVFITIAESHTETIISGYTHLQQAQPISLAHHLLAYVEMFERDKIRLSHVYKACDVMPLGSGALAGSTLPLDTEFLQNELGFASRCANSLDGVSDRDFVLDFIHACAAGMMHLSRLCEELIVWSSAEWYLARIGDAFTTGSSLMPQKKNPDIAELIRGKSNRVFADYQSVISLMKGLPLSYNRDMQEDKPALFHAYSVYASSLYMMKEMYPTIRFDNSSSLELMKKSPILATDAADWLVQKGIPFREAHDIVGGIVKYSLANKIPFSSLSLDELKNINPVFDETFLEVLNFETCLTKKKTYGSPNPSMVREQIRKWKARIGE